MLEINSVNHGDCLELMKEIPDKSIDMILCDLPYGTTACKWDILIDFEELWGDYRRIIKNKGAIVLTASQPFTTDLINSGRDLFRYEIIWQKFDCLKIIGIFFVLNFMSFIKEENIFIERYGVTVNGISETPKNALLLQKLSKQLDKYI